MNEEAMSLEALLVVGRRVRITISPECGQEQACRAVEDGQEVIASKGHPPYQDGRLGRIPRVEPIVGNGGHTIPVLYDEPYQEPIAGRLGVHIAGYFTASELIPLNDDGSEILHPMLARYER